MRNYLTNAPPFNYWVWIFFVVSGCGFMVLSMLSTNNAQMVAIAVLSQWVIPAMRWMTIFSGLVFIALLFFMRVR